MTRKIFSFLFSFICILVAHPLQAGNNTYIGSLTGTIKDKADGKPIAGATIAIPDLKTTTVSDANGKFTINLNSKGIHLVEVSYIGYGTFYQNVDFTRTSSLDVVLAQSTVEAEEIVVTGVSRATEIRRAPIPIVAVGKDFLQQHAGATNIIDAVANIPGVAAVTTGPNISKPFIDRKSVV